ncbi:MAG: hypothetical protein FWG35_05435, partial [Spirochaetaceae bacterium]|nr:hypothetical protein [Spirochaetaceae bacterium]
MSNIKKRLVLFAIAIPALGAIIFFLPQGHYAAISCLCIAALGVGALEAAGMQRARGVQTSRPVCFILGAAPAALAYLAYLGLVPAAAVVYFYVFAACALPAREVFHPREEDFTAVLPRLSAYFFILLYPGLFGVYVIR